MGKGDDSRSIVGGGDGGQFSIGDGGQSSAIGGDSG
jgi:hypothetical protein